MNSPTDSCIPGPVDKKQKNVEKIVCETLSEDRELKDILQLLREQSVKMEKLGLALEIIQDGMRQSTQVTIKTSVGLALISVFCKVG